jgi:GntR family transcriptional regulator
MRRCIVERSFKKMIDKTSPVPIYYQLEEQIKSMIDTKELNPGDLLPSEREFSETYGISRMTVRQAINNLVQTGLLYRVQGRGTFVAEKKFEQTLRGLTSFSEDMLGRGMTPSSQLLDFKIIPANAQITSDLGLKENEQVYEIKRIRLADNVPMALETTYIPVQLVEGLTEDVLNQSLYQFIEQKMGVTIHYATQAIEASIADSLEAEYLHIKKGAPILSIQRNTLLEDGTPVETVRSVYRADRYKFMIDMVR